MDEELKLDANQYQALEEDARKALEALSPEIVDALRRKAVQGIDGIILQLVNSSTSFFRSQKELEETKTPVGNPFLKPALGVLAGVAAYLIAATVFKVPTEFLYLGLPAGFAVIYACLKWAIHRKDNRKRAVEIHETFKKDMADSYSISSNMLDYMRDIRSAIAEDDVKLMIFCQSCKEFKLKPYIDITPNYNQIALLLFNNNISFQPSMFKTNSLVGKTISAVSSLVETISNMY